MVTATRDAANDEATATNQADDSPPQAVVSWHADIRPLSGPVLVEGVLVLYTLGDGDQLRITALDAMSGEELWSHPASASAIPSPRSLEPQIVEDAVVHLRPSGRADGPEDEADVIVRHGRRGTLLHGIAQGRGVHHIHPARCPGHQSHICLSVLADSGSPAWPTVLGRTPPDTAWQPGGDPTAGHFVERIGPIDLARGSEQRIGRLVDDTLLWAVSTGDIVGPDASTNSGWDFISVGDELLVGSVGLAHTIDGSDLDLTESAIFALDAQSGQRVWISRGTDIRCNSALWDLGAGPLLGCAYDAGSWHWADEGAQMRAVDMSVVRLEPTTGEELWRTHVGGGDLGGVVVPGVLDEDHAVVLDQVIDVRDGTTREREEDDDVWFPYLHIAEVEQGGTAPHQVSGRDLWQVPDGLDLEGGRLPVWPLPPGVGVELEDGSRVVTYQGGLTQLAAP